MGNPSKVVRDRERRMRYITALSLGLVALLVLGGFYSIASVVLGVYVAYWLYHSTWYSVNSMGVHGAIVYGAVVVVVSIIFAIGLGIHRGHAEELSLNGIAVSDVHATIKGHKWSRLNPFSKGGTECILKNGTEYLEVRPGVRLVRKAEVKVLAEPEGGVGNDGCRKGQSIHIGASASKAGIKALAERRKTSDGGNKE